jgi:adenylyltransferase/sulfurtransferase
MLAMKDFSEDDMSSIMKTRVAVVGAGGLGSPALRMLTAIGFGEIRIIDRDVVELSNIQRQTVFNTRDLDKPKAEAAADNLTLLNPEVKFDPISASLDTRNGEKLLKGSEFVIDGLDSFASRYAVNRASIALRIPYVYAGAIETYGNCTTFVPGATGCFRCFAGVVEDRPEYTCATVGVTPDILSFVASIEVREAILLGTHREPLLKGRLLTADIATLTMDTFEIHQDPNCPECFPSAKREPDSMEELGVTTLCSGAFCIAPREKMNLDLENLSERLRTKHRVKLSRNALKVFLDPPQEVTIMRQGMTLVRGARSKDEALGTYHDLLSS